MDIYQLKYAYTVAITLSLVSMVMIKLIEHAFKNALPLQHQHSVIIQPVYALINAQFLNNMETLMIYTEDV